MFVKYLVFILLIYMSGFSLAQSVSFLKAVMAFYTSLFKDSDWVQKGRGGRERRAEGREEKGSGGRSV